MALNLPWTNDEDKILIELYPVLGLNHCIQKLNRTKGAIVRRAMLLGVKSSRTKKLYSEFNIQQAVQSSKNMKECLIKLGLRAAGGNYIVLKKYIKKYNINTDHFETVKEKNARTIKRVDLDSVLTINSTYSRNSLKRRLISNGLLLNICSICGQNENWKGKTMSLILDHINGIHDDNRIENLRILCPNCNATLPTHCGRNKTAGSSNGRTSRL